MSSVPPDSKKTIVSQQEEVNNDSKNDLIIELKNFTIFPSSRNAPIVYRFNLDVRRGTLVALMGGSGCGKTTLMVYLTRRMRNPYTDWGVTADTYAHPRRVAFVAQKEMFYPYDTSLRHLVFLRQRSFVESMEASVDAARRTLQLVGLNDETKWELQIGAGGRESALSGGERRLLTVAAALITEPEVVILDEPTSGMDGYTALNIIQHLRHVAQAAHTTFVVSIHQPSDKVLSEFDFVERMTPPVGPFVRAPAIDGSGDKHDHFAKKEAKQKLYLGNEKEESSSTCLPKQEKKEADDASEGSADHLLVSEATFLPKFSHLLKLYLWRAFLRCWTNWRAGPLRLGASLTFAIMCGVAWVNLDFSDGAFVRDILGMALALIGLSFAPIILNATLFATEREVLLEEHVDLDHVALLADSLARWSSDIVLGAAAAVVLMVAIPIIGIKFVGWYFLTMWLQAWAADSFGVWISMVAVPHVAIGIVVPTVGFLSIALGTGLMQPSIEKEGYIFHILKWTSFFKYGFQALLLQELPRATKPCPTCFVPTGADMLDMMHLSGDSYEVTMGFQYLLLFSISIVLRVVAFLTLRGLILVGNRRYSYDNSSAGAASPADAALPAAVVPAAEHRQPGVHEPTDAVSVTTVDPEEVEPVAERPGGFPTGNGERCWEMSRVLLEPTLFQRLTCSGPKAEEDKKVLLDVPFLSIHPKETVAVIGPTGAGKTLLLRHLSSRLGDGVSTPSPTKFFSTCSVCREPTVQFVDGNDEILPNLRAVEPIAFHASLYDPTLTEQDILDSSAKQLLALGIHREKHNNMAYTLSGGQMRRLSVACKTVMQPAVLLIDEPTSGLDHDAALNLGRHLKNMAKDSGVAVICSLQQPDPELLECFDTFVFMRDGRVVVRGSEAECRAFLGISADAPSWAEDALHALARSCEGTICPSNERRIEEQVLTGYTIPGDENRVPIFHDPRRSMLYCVMELTKRSLLNRWVRAPRDTLTAFMIRYLLLPVCLSILLVNVGSKDPMYFNRSGLIFVYCACVSFSSMLNGAVTFPTQRRMVEEEINANLYTTTSYLVSQWFTVSLVEDMVGCVLGSIALKYIASLDANLGIIIAATFTISQCCDGIGYLCGLFRDLPVAAGLTVLVLMPFMIGGNVIATTEQVTRIPVLWVLEVLSSVRYAYLIIFHNELEQSTGSTAAANMVFRGYGLDPDNRWYQYSTLWPVFVCYAVLLRIVTVLVYKRLICPSCVAGQ